MHTISTLFAEESCQRLDESFRKIQHCFSQLPEEAIWHKPNLSSNSIGIIIQHLCGNIRQWIISGAGGKEDTRDRPQEFTDTTRADKTNLLHTLSQVVAQAKEKFLKSNKND